MGSCAAPSAKGDDKFITTDYLQQCRYYCLSPNHKIRYWTADGYSDEQWEDLADWIKQVWIDGN
ncbi:SMI1/KNR4 family protein [Acinetobacter baumannii]|uniref:SMI1/KNR4 family protein n=1 Tax=Acinetobacter baumannii TaxID=470 RepID=UPI00099595B1|nr:SMI1/KNR4 family protein [Acinetobacter baumannii]MBF6783881.1 hypothetical protein [Acinetobacter baumannii]MBF6790914.1 hypothetical protein [Acinetobacter baumannii]MBF6810567.1 hypothetical protein [Acinetobacter baumannii]MBF6834330.1 hypothetical protein [Acinetobacter baumannii]MBF6854082.1 hypothetical protein [Acinetobacter baumannii]